MPDYMPYMKMMGVPNQYSPMMEMPEDQLDAMYPKTYNIIYPHVKYHCDMHDNKYGMMHNPTKDQLDAMVNDIQKKVEGEVETEVSKDDKERQFGFGGRRILRDLISILLLRQLLGRRQYYGGYPYGGYYGGYPYGSYFGGYPGGFDGYGGY